MIHMKKKISLTPVTIAIPILLIAMLLYFILFFLPGQSKLTALRSEVALSRAQLETFQKYLSDISPLESDISVIQDEIDRMNSEDYTNDSTVSFVISDAIQRYNIALASVSLDPATTYEEFRALPINLAISGTMEDILKFIDHFENNEDGSYLVRAASMETNGTTTTANLLIYLCTPNM